MGFLMEWEYELRKRRTWRGRAGRGRDEERPVGQSAEAMAFSALADWN